MLANLTEALPHFYLVVVIDISTHRLEFLAKLFFIHIPGCHIEAFYDAVLSRFHYSLREFLKFFLCHGWYRFTVVFMDSK